MRHISLLSVFAAAMILAAPAAFAFQIQPIQTDQSGNAKFADPDAKADAMANHLSGDSNSGGMNLFGTHMSISGGSPSYGSNSPMVRDRFMGGPDAIGRAYTPSH